MTSQEAFVDSVDQDQTAQNYFLDYNLTVSSSFNGSVFVVNERAQFIYSVVKDVVFNIISHNKIS